MVKHAQTIRRQLFVFDHFGGLALSGLNRPLIFVLCMTDHMRETDLAYPSRHLPAQTVETLEQGMKMFKVNNKDTRTTAMASFWCLYC